MISHRIIGRGISAMTGIVVLISLSILGKAQTPRPTATESPGPSAATAQTLSPAVRQEPDPAALSREASPLIVKEVAKTNLVAEATEAPPKEVASAGAAKLPVTTNVPTAPPPVPCSRLIKADVVAFDQPYMFNRLGAARPG